MNVSRRRLLCLTAGLAGLPVMLSTARSEGFPSRPIRLVIPYPPGGVNDEVGRPWADKMKTLLGTVVVENVGGAGGALGASAVARAKPDGYTILLGNTGTQVVHPLAATRPTYDPIKSFEPISILGLTTVGVAVNPSVPAQTLKEFVAYARREAAKLSYGSPGVGSLSHLTAELFKSLIGAPEIVHVPYRGVGPAVADLISGRLALMMPNVTGQVLELHRAGKIRLLAVTSPGRISAAPEIPTAIEAGLAGMISQNFIGLFVPPRTPEAIIGLISQATRQAMFDLRESYVARGFEPMLESSTEHARQFIKEQIVQWQPVIKAIGLRLE
jgi:tripartite-type tricarboxylate transporter receptor subunit TctC